MSEIQLLPALQIAEPIVLSIYPLNRLTWHNKLILWPPSLLFYLELNNPYCMDWELQASPVCGLKQNITPFNKDDETASIDA